MNFIHHRWFQILVLGLLFFFGTEQAMLLTGNINFFPTVIMLGAFVVPATFVAYFYGRERTIDQVTHNVSPLSVVVGCFLAGGVIGVTIAGMVEYATFNTLGVLSLMAVGLIEEAAKLLFPLFIFMRGRYRSDMDGILFGVASGMGFAALETMGYGLVSAIQSNGNFGDVQTVLLFRGLVSPAGHAAWTGLICAVLWHDRNAGGGYMGAVGMFFLAAFLHTMWNLVSLTQDVTLSSLGYLIVGGISLGLLIRRLVHAGHHIQTVKEA